MIDTKPSRFMWSTHGLAPERRLAEWREMFVRTFIECDVTSPDDDFAAAIRFDRYGDVGVGALSAPRRRTITRPEHAKRNADGLTLDLIWSGRYRAEVGGRAIELGPGDGVLLHDRMADTMTALEPAEIRLVHIPAPLLTHVLGDTMELGGRVLHHEHPETRLLAAYLQAVSATAGLTDESTRRIIGQQIVDLVVTAIGKTHREAIAGAERGLRAARLKLAKDYVRPHLAEPMLNGERIARALGISERYLQRLFEDSGTTVSTFILEARLGAAKAAIADPAQDGRRIAEIAYGVGFSDVTHFNRAFKRRFGETPSAARSSGSA